MTRTVWGNSMKPVVNCRKVRRGLQAAARRELHVVAQRCGVAHESATTRLKQKQNARARVAPARGCRRGKSCRRGSQVAWCNWPDLSICCRRHCRRSCCERVTRGRVGRKSGEWGQARLNCKLLEARSNCQPLTSAVNLTLFAYTWMVLLPGERWREFRAYLCAFFNTN